MIALALFKISLFICCILSQQAIQANEKEKRILIEQSAYELVHKLSAQVGDLTKRLNESEAVKEASIHKLTAQVQELTRRLNESEKENRKSEKEIKSLQETTSILLSRQGSGATYVRWGRTTCPSNGSHLVYAGIAGGQREGSPSLCVPPNPDWSYYQTGFQNGSLLYGVEYEFDLHNGASAFFSLNLNDQNAPCSVCATERTRVLMIPGKNNCTPGWTKEYDGYLVSAHFKTEQDYVCLDGRPEEVAGGKGNEAGGGMFLVEVVCGTLQCPPYVDGREMTCVVCSQ